jgi:hypothetical protein
MSHTITVLFHGINLLWSPVFHELFDVKMDGPCYKFVKPISSFNAEEAIVLPGDLKMSTLEKEDVEIVSKIYVYIYQENCLIVILQVHSTNKITYDINYVQDCFRISSAIRRANNNEMAAWSMTHRDCK